MMQPQRFQSGGRGYHAPPAHSSNKKITPTDPFKPPSVKPRAKPPWDDTIHDLNAYKLTEEEIAERKQRLAPKQREEVEEEQRPPRRQISRNAEHNENGETGEAGFKGDLLPQYRLEDSEPLLTENMHIYEASQADRVHGTLSAPSYVNGSEPASRATPLGELDRARMQSVIDKQHAENPPTNKRTIHVRVPSPPQPQRNVTNNAHSSSAHSGQRSYLETAIFADEFAQFEAQRNKPPFAPNPPAIASIHQYGHLLGIVEALKAELAREVEERTILQVQVHQLVQQMEAMASHMAALQQEVSVLRKSREFNATSQIVQSLLTGETSPFATVPPLEGALAGSGGRAVSTTATAPPSNGHPLNNSEFSAKLHRDELPKWRMPHTGSRTMSTLPTAAASVPNAGSAGAATAQPPPPAASTTATTAKPALAAAESSGAPSNTDNARKDAIITHNMQPRAQEPNSTQDDNTQYSLSGNGLSATEDFELSTSVVHGAESEKVPSSAHAFTETVRTHPRTDLSEGGIGSAPPQQPVATVQRQSTNTVMADVRPTMGDGRPGFQGTTSNLLTSRVRSSIGFSGKPTETSNVEAKSGSQPPAQYHTHSRQSVSSVPQS